MARVLKGIKKPHPLGSVATRSGYSQTTANLSQLSVVAVSSASTGVKISELPAASAANTTDQIEVNQSGTSRSITVDQLSDQIIGDVDLSGLATKTGTLTPGNVPILTATGIADSGVGLVSTMAATTVWSNNSSSAAAPAANTRLTLGNGTAAAPIYSFSASSGTGLYASGTDVAAVSIAGNRVTEWSTGNANNYIQFLANSTPQVRVQGTGGNVDLELLSLGTGTLSLRCGAAYTLRCLGVASGVNYVTVTSAVSGANPKVAPNAENLILGTGTALATNATAGFIMIPTCAGTPTGAPTGASANTSPLVYDTTANKLWIHNAGTWRGVVVT